MSRSSMYIFIIAVIAAPVAVAQSSCTQADHDQEEREAVTLRSWDALYRSYLRYGHCPDVDAEEGYSESIARVLVDHWKTLPRLSQLIKKNKAFGDFVGLDATMDVDDVRTIRKNAIVRCPAGSAQLCSRLRNEADETITEITSAH